ncbi:MAG: hypothetical protein OEV62_03780 [Actinomycetota bacterium]|nr:hypothetical protein [Actinomycetota bacterium]
MTRASLREALHDVAEAGTGEHTATRAVVLGDAARAEAARRRRQAWTVAVSTVAVATVVAVMSVAVTVRTPPVEPADGPGSLPDQIYPSREHVLSLEQAPIGRVSLVYSGPLVDGATSWVAVGADSDDYRFVAPVASEVGSGNGVDVSPDGLTVAIGRGGAARGDLGVDLVSAVDGQSRRVPVPEAPLGGEVQSLRWSPDGGLLVAQVAVVVSRDGGSETSRMRMFVVDPLAASGRLLPESRWDGEQVLGWLPTGEVVVGRQVCGLSCAGDIPLAALDDDGARRLGAVVASTLARLSPWSLSPDGSRLAGLLDPNDDNQAGVTEPRVLAVWTVADGQLASRTQLGRVGVGSEVVGWQDSSTPVLSEVRGPHKASPSTSGADYVGQLVAYPQTGGTGGVTALTVANLGQASSFYMTARVAADVLAGGQVRDAGPPHQPWYDPRTAGPWLWDRWVWLVLAGLLVLGVGAALVTRRRRSQTL